MTESNLPFRPLALEKKHRPITDELFDLEAKSSAPISFVGYRIQPGRTYELRVRSRVGLAEGSEAQPVIVDTPSFIDFVGEQQNEANQVVWKIKSLNPGFGLLHLVRLQDHAVIRIRMKLREGQNVERDVPILMSGYGYQLALFIFGTVALTSLDFLPIDGIQGRVAIVVALVTVLTIVFTLTKKVFLLRKTLKEIAALRKCS